MTYIDEESGLPFKIIEAGVETLAPTGTTFRAFKPTGVNAIVKAEVDTILQEWGSDAYATGGIYTNAGKDTYGIVRGRYNKIRVDSGSVIAWYK